MAALYSGGTFTFLVLFLFFFLCQTFSVKHTERCQGCAGFFFFFYVKRKEKGEVEYFGH